MNENSVYKILAFGDSLTEGYVDDNTCRPYTIHLHRMLTSSYPNITFDVDNKGIYGELVCGEMTVRLQKILQECGPYKLVIILGGTNDICEAKEGMEESLFRGIISLHCAVRAHDSKSVMVTMPETDVNYKDLGTRGMSWVKQEGETTRLIVNQKLREYASDFDDVILCDLAVKFPQQSMSEEDMDKYWIDGIHYTEEGYKRMAEIIFNDIQDHLV